MNLPPPTQITSLTETRRPGAGEEEETGLARCGRARLIWGLAYSDMRLFDLGWEEMARFG